MMPRRSLFFVLRTTLILSMLVALLIPLAAGAGFIGVLLSSGCGGGESSLTNPEAFADAREVMMPSARWGDTPAYWIVPPNANGAAIIVVPTNANAQGDRAHEFIAYLRAGYSVLSYASAACQGQGFTSLGYSESFQVADAIAFVSAQPGIDPARIGLHGFSAGGASALLAAARYPQIAAVVAEGNYLDFSGEIASNSTAWGLLGYPFRWGAAAFYRLRTGEPIEVLRPGDAIPAIAPRPILLIYGADLLPDVLAAVAAAAETGAPVTLWEVAGATHGSYVFTAPDEYPARIVGFMDAALRP